MSVEVQVSGVAGHLCHLSLKAGPLRVSKIKKEISEVLKVPVEQQRLLHGDSELQDGHVLSRPCAELTLIKRPAEQARWRWQMQQGMVEKLKEAPGHIKEDRDVVMAAVSVSGCSLEFAASNLKADPELVLAAVENDWRALQFAAASLRDNERIVLAAVQQDWTALQFAAPSARGKHDIALAAMGQAFGAILFIDHELRKDRTFLLSALNAGFCKLEFAAATLRGDKELVLAAVKHHGQSLADAHESLQGDREELGEEDKLIEDVNEPMDDNGPTALHIFRYKALVATIILAIASSSHHPLLQIQDLTSIARKYENLDTWLFNGEPVTGAAATSAGFSSAPAENMHDGNLCGDDEELFEDLCYMKCSLLTEGKNPIRTSAFTCCESHPCSFSNTIFNMNAPCAGFDVAGKINGQKGACPHTIGTCLEDEELLLGMCYKKCSLLTGGQFTHRVAATTCCSQTGLACLNPMNLRTNFVDFPVGGGKGDGTKSTPSKPHKPLKVLTEKNTTASTAPTSVSSAITPSSPQTAEAPQATSAPL